MSGERYTLDANVLFYAIDTDAGVKHRTALRLLRATRDRNCIFAVQTLAETYAAIGRKNSAMASDAREVIRVLSRKIPVVAANADDLQHALELHAKRPLHFWDTLLWATMRRNGCRTVLSEDAQDRRLSDEVRYLNPFAAESIKELEDFV